MGTPNLSYLTGSVYPTAQKAVEITTHSVGTPLRLRMEAKRCDRAALRAGGADGADDGGALARSGARVSCEGGSVGDLREGNLTMPLSALF